MNKVNESVDKCYKVVSTEVMDEYHSFSSPFGWELIYSIGEKVRPIEGKIFVFANLEDAEDFKGFNPYFAILECEGYNLQPLKYAAAKASDFIDFWAGKEVETFSLPRRTYVVDCIKPLRKVKL